MTTAMQLQIDMEQCSMAMDAIDEILETADLTPEQRAEYEAQSAELSASYTSLEQDEEALYHRSVKDWCERNHIGEPVQ